MCIIKSLISYLLLYMSEVKKRLNFTRRKTAYL